jgi:heat shock protein HtpX
MNHIRTFMMMAALVAICGVAGIAMGGFEGLVLALIFAVVTNAFAFWKSDSLALKAHGAQEVTMREAPELVELVHALAERAEIPPPRVFVTPSPQPNAFATGRNPEKSAVAVTTGLIEMLSKEELAGVIAHELAHIKSRDTLTMTIAATFAGAISSLANFTLFFGSSRSRGNPFINILFLFLGPLAAAIIQMAISRSREYEADRVGAEISGNPLWLASALEKIHDAAKRIPNEQARWRPATAHMFIINPLFGGRMDGLFTTHPRTENRVAALLELAEKMGIRIGAPQRPLQPRTAGPSSPRGPWG